MADAKKDPKPKPEEKERTLSQYVVLFGLHMNELEVPKDKLPKAPPPNPADPRRPTKAPKLALVAWVPVVDEKGDPLKIEAASKSKAIDEIAGTEEGDIVAGRWKAVAASNWPGWKHKKTRKAVVVEEEQHDD